MADVSHIGVHIGEGDEELLDEFDATFGTDPKYSRSKEVKRAMRTHLIVEEALQDVGAEVAPREREHLLRQAIFDLFREE